MERAHDRKQEAQTHHEPAATRRNYEPELRIGTSGWHYAGWWGPFYPKEVKKKDALSYYVTQFNTTELNAPFYRTPTEKAVENWRDSVPDDFRYAWKASKFITHWRRLNFNEHSMELLESRLKLLGKKLGPVLFQLPPNFKADGERLANFLKNLPKRRHYSFEIPPRELVRKNDLRPACTTQRLALPFRPCRCARAARNHRRLGLRTAAWPERPLSRHLCGRCAEGMGAVHAPLAARRARCLVLLRQ
jgi:uncharacterized protein YecE (DUF72 family)